jgi:AcrR family transcriptional regulator
MTAVMTVVTHPNRTRPRAELRNAIYQAALGLFRERGYAQTSVDDVVGAAGVAKGTFFNFFPTKLEVMKVYYAAIDIEVVRCREQMDPAAPTASLRTYAAAVEDILLREGRLMLDLLDLAMSDPAMRRIDEASGASDADEFATFLLQAQNRGLIGRAVDPVFASAALVDLWAGAIRAWLAHPASGALPVLFGWRVDLLFKGLEHHP